MRAAQASPIAVRSSMRLWPGLRRMATASTSGAEEVASRLEAAVGRVRGAWEAAGEKARSAQPPLLLAVSKTKPAGLIAAAYAAGQRDFAENYAQELLGKAADEDLRRRCPELRWHFVGALQTNKAGKVVAGVPGLASVHSLSSERLARRLDAACARAERPAPLDVFVQVNTSGEEAKSGLGLEDAVRLAAFVRGQCPSLRLAGLMTIGALTNSAKASAAGDENPDFRRLRDARAAVAEELGVEERGLGLSMGMSQDFQAAIAAGATVVRLGSTIFGPREKKV